jgi:hypothetical protein
MINVSDDGDVSEILNHKKVPTGARVEGGDYTASCIRKG